MLKPDPAFLKHVLRDPYSGGEAGVNRCLSEVENLAAEWGVVLDSPVTGASCSLVFRGWRSNGDKVILKLPVIGEEKTSGAMAAVAFGGRGGIEILESDRATGALLMPLADPGTDLFASGVTDDEALSVCVEAITSLREVRTNLDPFRATVNYDWFESLRKPTSPKAEPHLVESAKVLLAKLEESTEREVLLHGDLHHFNILRHEETWTVIDPKGLVGDPAREVVGFMRNPLPWIGEVDDLEAVLENRLDRFAEALGDPIERLWAWSLVETTADALDPISRFSSAWGKVNGALASIGARRGWKIN